MSSAKIPFRNEMRFDYGVAQPVSPLIRRVVVNNPGPFTFHGTNTYIVGHGEVAVIDPGPDDDAHVAALVAALAGETLRHILVTHTHHDHSPAAAPLRAALGGRIIGAHPRPMKQDGTPTEAIHGAFAPDQVLADGQRFAGPGWTLEAVFTPGHMSNHHCFALVEEGALFTGDHVMGWNTSIVSPPDGNMTEYLASLRLCAARNDTVYWPAHGPEIDRPQAFVRAYIGHRRMREGEIRRCLADGLATIPEMVAAMYRHLPERMHGAAARSVLAHLEHMTATGRAACDGPASADARYRPPGAGSA
jgi:glyoxylase-like metal-dependent hydrolase (beta-lactamase superfamily II)